MRISVHVTVPPPSSANVSHQSTYHKLFQRSRSAAAVASQISQSVLGLRPGTLVGAWIPAIDPATFEYDVLLPCILAQGLGWDSSCLLTARKLFAQPLHAWELVLIVFSAIALARQLGDCARASCMDEEADPTSPQVQDSPSADGHLPDEPFDSSKPNSSADHTPSTPSLGSHRSRSPRVLFSFNSSTPSSSSQEAMEMQPGCRAIDSRALAASIRSLWNWTFIVALISGDMGSIGLSLGALLGLMAIFRTAIVLEGHSDLIGLHTKHKRDDAAGCGNLSCCPQPTASTTRVDHMHGTIIESGIKDITNLRPKPLASLHRQVVVSSLEDSVCNEDIDVGLADATDSE